MRRATHVLRAHLVAALERRQDPRRAGGHEIPAHAVDADFRARAHDPRQLPLAQPHAGQPHLRRRDPSGDIRVAFPVCDGERHGVGLVGQPPADDLGADLGVGRRAHLDGESEAVEQLRAQLALLGVHRPDEQEAGVVAYRDGVALDVADPHRGGVEEDVDEMVGQQVDLVDVQDAAMRARQQAGFEGPFACQRAPEVQRADEPVDRRADRQLHQRRGPWRDLDRAVHATVGREVAGSEAEGLVDGRRHRREQRRQRAHGGRLRRPALAAHEHAADLRADGVDEQRLEQRLLADDRREREGRRHAWACSSSPSSSR